MPAPLAPLRGAGWPSWREVAWFPGDTVVGATATQGAWSSTGSVIEHHHVFGFSSTDRLLLADDLHGAAIGFRAEVSFPVGRANAGSPLWEMAGFCYGGDGGSGIGLMLDGLPSIDHLYVQWCDAGDDIPGTIVDLGLGWAEGDWIRLECVHLGRHVWVWVDGTLVASAANLSGGSQMGLCSYLLGSTSYADGAMFRNVAIYEADLGWPS